jgi:hypothetical protein
MRRSGGRWLIRAVLAGGLLAAACGSDDAGPTAITDAAVADGTTTAAEPEGSVVPSAETLGGLLLTVVPAGDGFEVALNDTDRLVTDAGLDPLPSGLADVDEADRARVAMALDWGMANLHPDLGRSEVWLETLGFGPSDVARAARVSAGPERVITMVGDFDPDGVVTALGDWSDVEVREAEPWVLVEEPGEEGTAAEAITPVNRVGVPLRYGIASDRFVMTSDSELRDAAIEGLDGGGPTVADEPGWEPLAEMAEERGWYSLYAVTHPTELPEWFEQEDPDDLPPRPLVRAVGLSVEDDAPLPHLAFVYDDPDQADDAARLLRRRLVTTTTLQGERWLDLAPDASVTVAGATALLELPGLEPGALERAIFALDSIIRTR